MAVDLNKPSMPFRFPAEFNIFKKRDIIVTSYLPEDITLQEYPEVPKKNPRRSCMQIPESALEFQEKVRI